jgi:hypothetical protein
MEQNFNLALQIVNQDDRQFNVRLVRQNGVYGADDSLLHQQAEPLVEFFDASNLEEDNRLGYFTGIRCALGTLFQTAFELGSNADVLFNESLPMWNISTDNISDIQDWLLEQLTPEEKRFIRQPNARSRAEPALAEDSAAAPVCLAALPQAAGENAFRRRLLALIQDLEELESQAPQWRQGQVQARLALLAAKRELLLALASLPVEE